MKLSTHFTTGETTYTTVLLLEQPPVAAGEMSYLLCYKTNA